jgi:PAS domain S-box-containing protein
MDQALEPHPDELFRRMVDGVPSMLALWGRDLRCRFANQAYQSWFGVDARQLVGSSLRDLLGPALFALNEPHVRAVLEGRPQRFERVVPGADGMLRHSLAHYLPDRVGDEVVGFIAYVTEISGLKQTEADLQSAVRSLEAEVHRRTVTEAQLAETQQSLDITLASIGAGLLVTDAVGRITRMNAVVEQITGWPAALALGESFWRVFVREGRPAIYAERNPIDLMIEQGITAEVATQVTAVARDGRRLPVEVRAALTMGDDGAVRGMVVVLRDMSRLLHAEGQANQLAAIVESSQDAIVGKTLAGTITSWNAAATALFGYRADEAIGRPVQMLIPPDRADEEMAILTRLARGERVPAFDTLRLAKDGSLREVSVTISPVRDAAGRIAGASKIARDISAQRSAENARRQSEDRLRFTLEAAQIGDWEIDLDTGASQRSLRHDRCFGYDRLQPEWSLETLVRHVHPQDRASLVAAFDEATMQGRDWTTQCRVIWPDGSLHWISLHGSVLREDGRARRVLGIVTDITDQKLAEQARLTAMRLEAENRQVLEASRTKSLFLANMSHELRTPLNAIIGFADLLRTGAVPPDSPKQALFLGHVANSGRHLLQLINEVLDLSKVEAGKFEFFPEPVDPAAMVGEVIDGLHPALVQKSIAVAVQIDAALGPLVIDRARLKQVLYNYLSNAIKFSPPGAEVALRMRAVGERQFRLEVEDHGIGIAKSQQPLLFTEFQQLDASLTKQHQGTGLGLALVRRLVQAQGGRVGLRSDTGQGALFYAELDRVHTVHGAAPAQAATGGEGRVLVIEPDLLLQSRLERGLHRAGFEVDAAGTGEQALSLAGSLVYEALTLRLRWAEHCGLDLLARIRQGGPNRAAPVLGMSVPVAGRGSDAWAGRNALFAVADVLGKPLLADEVAAAMARFRRSSGPPARVMVIDDDPLARQLMHEALVRLGIEAQALADGASALVALGAPEGPAPDAIILDLMMPGMDGFGVLDALQRLPQAAAIPVYIWTSMILTEEEYASLARTAWAIVSKGGGELETMLETLGRWRPAGSPASPKALG